jgi:hypothetical protein
MIGTFNPRRRRLPSYSLLLPGPHRGHCIWVYQVGFTIMTRGLLDARGVLGSTPDIGAGVLVALLELELLATATGVSDVELGAH